MKFYYRYLFLVLTILSIVCCNISSKETPAIEENDPPEILHGERLFLETRFAHLFYEHLKNGGNTNKPMPEGDPALNKTVRFFGLPPYQIPFAKSNCNGNIDIEHSSFDDRLLQFQKMRKAAPFHPFG